MTQSGESDSASLVSDLLTMFGLGDASLPPRPPSGWEPRTVYVPPGHSLRFDIEQLERTGWAPICITRDPVSQMDKSDNA